MKKVFLLFICFIFITMPAFAIKGVKFIAETLDVFNPDEIIVNNLMHFKTNTIIQYDENIIIPIDSIITAKYESSVKERRFHKSGFFTCKLIKYTDGDKEIDISSKKMKIIGKKYEKIDGKEAAKTGAELATTTAAGFIIPGVDIAYYFVKGAIQNEKAETRLKSGVHNAYDNSIMWFFLKGKPIILSKGDFVTILMFHDDGNNAEKELEKYCE